MENIPIYQRKSPATHEDVLAYLPACSQLIERFNSETNKTDYGVILPSGEFYVLWSLSPNSYGVNHPILDSLGICKNQGQNVPIVSPQNAVFMAERPVLTNVNYNQSNTPQILLSLSFFLIGMTYLCLTNKETIKRMIEKK